MIRAFLDLDAANDKVSNDANGSVDLYHRFDHRFSINCLVYDYRHWQEIGGIPDDEETGLGAMGGRSRQDEHPRHQHRPAPLFFLRAAGMDGPQPPAGRPAHGQPAGHLALQIMEQLLRTMVQTPHAADSRHPETSLFP